MPAPDQRAAVQLEDAFRLTSNRAGLRMDIVGLVREVLVVLLVAPGELVCIFALPVHSGFVADLVALHRPLAGKRESCILDIGPLLRRLCRGERRSGLAVRWDNGKY